MAEGVEKKEEVKEEAKAEEVKTEPGEANGVKRPAEQEANGGPAPKVAKESKDGKEKKEGKDKDEKKDKKEKKEKDKEKDKKEEKKDKEKDKEKDKKEDKKDKPQSETGDLKKLDHRQLFKEGQRNLTPPMADATRAFYTSLLEEKPDSKVAIKFCVEFGVFSQEEHKKLFKRYNQLKEKGAFNDATKIKKMIEKKASKEAALEKGKSKEIKDKKEKKEKKAEA